MVSGSGTQYSGTDLASLIPPSSKGTSQEDEDNDLGKEVEDYNAPKGSLILISESAAAFLETVQ